MVSLYCRPRAVAQVDPAQVVVAHVPDVVSKFDYNSFNKFQQRLGYGEAHTIQSGSSGFRARLGGCPSACCCSESCPSESLQSCNIYSSMQNEHGRQDKERGVAASGAHSAESDPMFASSLGIVPVRLLYGRYRVRMLDRLPSEAGIVPQSCVLCSQLRIRQRASS